MLFGIMIPKNIIKQYLCYSQLITTLAQGKLEVIETGKVDEFSDNCGSPNLLER